jgi:hypothetical protein
MKKLMVSMALLMMLGAPGAFAQGGSTGAGANKAGGNSPKAPVGHLQPRRSDVPDEKNLSNPNDAANREDAMLDKKIRSICRGC